MSKTHGTHETLTHNTKSESVNVSKALRMMNTEAFVDLAEERRAWKAFSYAVLVILAVGVVAFLSLHGCQSPASAATEEVKTVRYVLPDAPVSNGNPFSF